jgi:anti-sigma B factor antagonist
MILDADIDSSNPAAPIVKLSGRMTLGTRLREVEARIDEVIDGGADKLILDLSGVAYADSAGLGLIMILYGRMKSIGGRLRIVGPNESLRTLFSRTCVDSILAVDPDLAAAIAA